jgi:hypothetical protein
MGKGSRECVGIRRHPAITGLTVATGPAFGGAFVFAGLISTSGTCRAFAVASNTVYIHSIETLTSLAMLDAALLENEDSELDRAQFERAIQRAANDLQRIIGTLVQRYLPRRSSSPSTLTWRWLIELEEQAFSDLGFQSRHDKAIIGAFLRLRDSRLFGANIDETVDWITPFSAPTAWWRASDCAKPRPNRRGSRNASSRARRMSSCSPTARSSGARQQHWTPLQRRWRLVTSSTADDRLLAPFRGLEEVTLETAG